MTQSAGELQYLQATYKEMQEQMAKQKEKTMAANAVRGPRLVVTRLIALYAQKIKELSLRMEFAAEKQVLDAAPPSGLVTYAALDIDVRRKAVGVADAANRVRRCCGAATRARWRVPSLSSSTRCALRRVSSKAQVR